jgi:tRNA-specific 2-thiouridylase
MAPVLSLRNLTKPTSSRHESQELDITFDEPLKGVALGQVSALWDGDWCLGCGVITNAE